MAPTTCGGPDAIRYWPLRWPGHLVERQAGARHMLLRGPLVAYQLVLECSLEAGDVLAIAAPADGLFEQRIAAAQAFLRHVSGLGAASGSRGSRRLVRLNGALDAYDAWQRSGSYRAAAELLFGGARVAAEPWKTSSLRDAAIRLVRLGRRHVDGGYRELLRAGD